MDKLKQAEELRKINVVWNRIISKIQDALVDYKVLTAEDIDDIVVNEWKKERKFVMERINLWEIEYQRKFYLEPLIIDQLVFYILESWKDKKNRKRDIDWLNLKIEGDKS